MTEKGANCPFFCYSQINTNKKNSMAIKIYSTEGSRGVRPIWTAEEMGLDYEIEMMPFPPRFLKPEYLEVNMSGTIPYMICLLYTSDTADE